MSIFLTQIESKKKQHTPNKFQNDKGKKPQQHRKLVKREKGEKCIQSTTCMEKLITTKKHEDRKKQDKGQINQDGN